MIRVEEVTHFQRIPASRREGNFVAIELKRRATKAEALGDFASLQLMHEALAYPLMVFLNIDSDETFSTDCPPAIASHTRCVAVKLVNGKVKITLQ